MSRRTYAILAALALIGAASLTTKVLTDDAYSTGDAFLDLGVELLKAAILFVLVNGAIDRHEAWRQDRLRAVRDLRSGRGSAASQLEAMEARGTIKLGDLSRTQLRGIELREKRLTDGRLDRADLSKMQLLDCTVDGVSLAGSDLHIAVCERCTWEDVALSGADLSGALFADCAFDGRTSFHGCNLAETRFLRCSFGAGAAAGLNGGTFIDCTGLDEADRRRIADGGGVERSQELAR